MRWMASSSLMSLLSACRTAYRLFSIFQRSPRKFLTLMELSQALEGSFARQCLMARRLSEAGVRFVEIRQPGWDHHTNLHNGLIEQCRRVDQPTSALLTDLAQRGLLEDTLVLFGSEFGRLPTSQGPDGRDHNIIGYSMFLDGSGGQEGFSYGEQMNSA